MVRHYCVRRDLDTVRDTQLNCYTPVTRRSVNAVTPRWPKHADCSVTFIILCVAVTRHDVCVTPSRLIEGTAARPSYDALVTCVTDPRLAHDRHDRRTTPSRRFQYLCVMLWGTRLHLVGGRPASSSPSSSTDPNSQSSPTSPLGLELCQIDGLGLGNNAVSAPFPPPHRAHSEGDRQAYLCLWEALREETDKNEENIYLRCALCDNRSRTDQCASRLIIYISRISLTGVVAQSPTRHAIHGCVGDRCATPPRPMRE